MTEKETIQMFVKRFKRYAHNDNPKCDIKECPEDCIIGHTLNLDTAMAWVVSWYLNRKDIHLQEVRNRIDSFMDVVDLHNGYKTLWQLLARCYWFLAIQIKDGE